MVATTTRTTLKAALLGATVAVGYGCERPLSIMDFSGPTMGTSYDVLVETEVGEKDSLALGAVIARELARVNRVMSTFDSSSDVSRFGRHLGTDPVPVDQSLLEVLESALEVSRRSSGAFDPTVAPLVEAWGFGPDDGTPPDSARVADLRELVGYEYLILDLASSSLAKTSPSVRIDLSAVAKGLAAERIGAVLLKLGYESALVDVGGELRAVGTHVDGRPWRVALEGPGADRPGPMGTIDLVDEAVATSGDYRNFYEDGGVRYAHIIDPRSGSPIPYRGFSVSVVHPNATMADAWATALTVLGPDEGFELAEREGLAAIFTWRTAEGQISRGTSALADRVNEIR